MNLTDRDRRILIILIPIVLLVGYWFLLLSPKRDDLKTADEALTAAEQRRDDAQARLAQLQRARQTFASDYAAVVRLGKAIPATIDSPSLLIQLDEAADGTAIDFDSVTFGERQTGIATPATPAAQPAAGAEGDAAAGGAPAQTAPGQAAEGAAEGVNQANSATQAQQGVAAATQPTTPEGTTTTTPAPAPATGTAAASQTTGGALDSVALTFNFSGTYFDLADFFHRIKRFVYVQDDRIFVRGRLLTVDSLSFAIEESDAGPSGNLSANVGATVYLTPRPEGVTAGATPAGPAGTEAAPAAGTAKKRSRSRTTTATAVPLR